MSSDTLPRTAAQGIVTKASPYSVAETLQRLEAVLREKGITVFALIDHSGEAERAGLKMQDAKLLIFGSPKAGTPLMVTSPLLALDLPLKALIWQNEDGRVWVSYNSTRYLASRHAIPDDLVQNIAGIDVLVASALQDAKAADEAHHGGNEG